MARIVNMTDPDSSELYPSLEAAIEAFQGMIATWKARGYEVKANEDKDHRVSVSDGDGQFVGEFYVEE